MALGRFDDLEDVPPVANWFKQRTRSPMNGANELPHLVGNDPATPTLSPVSDRG
jgi:hypothetical protein